MKKSQGKYFNTLNQIKPINPSDWDAAKVEVRGRFIPLMFTTKEKNLKPIINSNQIQM